jgi:hypothetical protein
MWGAARSHIYVLSIHPVHYFSNPMLTIILQLIQSLSPCLFIHHPTSSIFLIVFEHRATAAAAAAAIFGFVF